MVCHDALPAMNLALKVTNWCNLCCAHCCERSHIKEPFNLMPIDTVKRYIEQCKYSNIPTWDYITFTGGESMAPYFSGNEKYIPTVSEICIKNGFAPAFKTNANWNPGLANRILKDIADIVHKHDCQISLDISIDEYHDNLPMAANVINQIMTSQYLSAAIPVTLVGLNTTDSQYKYNEFINILHQRGIFAGPMDKTGAFIISKAGNVNVMFYDIGGLTRIGRAADNDLTPRIPTGRPAPGETDCLLITNDNRAILNYKHTTTTGNKTIGQIYNELKLKKR